MDDLPLRDIHLPDPVSFSSFIIFTSLLVVVGLSLVVVAYFIIKRHLKLSLKVQATQVLKDIETTFYENCDAPSCIAELSAFLRRVMISLKRDTNIAGVTGMAWLKLLDEPLKEPEFSEGIGKLLLTGPYSKEVSKEEVIKLLLLSSKWVREVL